MATKTTTTTGEPQPARYLLMTEHREHGYFHLYGRVVTQRYEQGAYRPDTPEDEYTGGTLYSGLRLTCQGDETSRQRAMSGERDAPVYGYACEYRDVYSIDRRRAERMAKTLTSLERKLEKLHEVRGHVHTYGEYCGRVAEALGCQGFAFERTAKSRDVTGQRWQWESLGYGVSRIDRLTAAWTDEARPQPEAEPEPEPAPLEAAEPEPSQQLVATPAGPVSDRTCGTAADYGSRGDSDEQEVQ